MAELNDIEQLQARLNYREQQYSFLAKKVQELLQVQQDCKKNNNRSDLLHKKWNLEAEINKLLNPAKVSQAQFNWLSE